jgi:hypothetical protein
MVVVSDDLDSKMRIGLDVDEKALRAVERLELAQRPTT